MKDYAGMAIPVIDGASKKELSSKLAFWLEKQTIWFFPKDLVKDLKKQYTHKRKKKFKKLLKEAVGQDSHLNDWHLCLREDGRIWMYNSVKPTSFYDYRRDTISAHLVK